MASGNRVTSGRREAGRDPSSGHGRSSAQSRHTSWRAHRIELAHSHPSSERRGRMTPERAAGRDVLLDQYIHCRRSIEHRDSPQSTCSAWDCRGRPKQPER